MGTNLNLTEKQQSVLAAMGIQVWYERGGASPVEVQGTSAETLAKPVDLIEEPVPAPLVEPTEFEAVTESAASVEFLWWQGTAGLLLANMGGNYDERLLVDLAIALDWQSGAGVGRVHSGHFRWPQLTTTSGTPERAMAAFLDKNLPENSQWLVVAQPLHDELSTYLDIGINVSQLPAQLKTPDQKKSLWQHLVK